MGFEAVEFHLEVFDVALFALTECSLSIVIMGVLSQ